jgi:DNA-binding NtrC family response regulator
VADHIRVLVVEDDPALLEILCEDLQQRGHVTAGANRVSSALEQLRASDFDVAMVDLRLPDGSGIEVLREIAREELPMECIVLTGYAEVTTAIEAMKLGAYDYLTKPARLEEIEVLIPKAAEKARLRRENVALKQRLERHDRSEASIVTEDPAMRNLLAILARAAPSDLPVLIEGETGTGKELIARAVHQQSPRAGAPFIAVNCSAMPDTLAESELFGHEKGAFTGAIGRKPGVFELADRGVLFLDEIGEVSPAIQVKLLRAIEVREFLRVGGTRPVHIDIRIVAATNKTLKLEVDAGRFREDLYYRLSGLTLRLPPLRDRPGDIQLLAEEFLSRFSSRARLSSTAVERLLVYAWPGNVRELQMVMRRAAVLCAKDTIEPEDIPLDPPSNWKAAVRRSGLTLDEMEREYIEAVLAEHNGHRGNAAKALGIDPKTLYNKLGSTRPRAKED